MITILILNAVSSLLAALGIGGYLVQQNRSVRRKARIVPIYVTARTGRERW
jgi:hypothetical protein